MAGRLPSSRGAAANDPNPGGGDSCPDIPGAYDTFDNPNWPGPDPLNPGAPGDDEDYIDWADLPERFLFTDPVTNDNIWSPDSCFRTGNTPNKANIRFVGMAANDVYLYLEMERETTNGNEEYHFLFTKDEPHFGPKDGCPADTLLWNLRRDDIQVVVHFPNTSDLAGGTVEVLRYNDDDTPDADIFAQAALQSPKWEPVNNAAYLAFNVTTNIKTDPTDDIDTDGLGSDEDRERDRNGVVLATGQAAEVAVDIARVFGDVGCGLNRSATVITTASGSPDQNDDLKDLLGPLSITTGTIDADIVLSPSCSEEFGYQVTVNDSDGNPVPLDGTLVDVDIVYALRGRGGSHGRRRRRGGDDQRARGGLIKTCTVNAVVTGKDGTNFQGCQVSSESAQQDVYPNLSVSASLNSPGCDGSFTYASTVLGGSKEPVTYAWTFSPGGTSSSPSGTVQVSGVAPTDVTASLQISQPRDGLACPANANATVRVHHPLNVSLSLLSNDLVCPVSGADEANLLFGNVSVQAHAWYYGASARGSASTAVQNCLQASTTTSVDPPDALRRPACLNDIRGGILAALTRAVSRPF